MKAPVLNRALVLETPERVNDGAGGVVETWVARGTLWAEVAMRGGGEALALAVPVARMTHRITCRAAPMGAPSRPAPGDRFREGARLFRLLAVSEADPEGRFLTCLAEEEGAR